ncbi:N-6 DNA methylase [Candidatus Nomurabacteria bacterium]|nr:N-6 DNA methylase [Candidatus Nomurabacteria bacterium]
MDKKNIFCNLKDLKNEDSVEKLFIDRLVVALGYRDKDVKTKISIKELVIGKGRKKENHKPDYVLYKNKKPVVVIDAKPTWDNIDDYIYQTSGYSLALNQTFKDEDPIKYFILSNGLTTKLYNWNYTEEPILVLKFDDFQTNNPNYKKLLKTISFNEVITSQEKNKFKFEKVSTDEIEGIFEACHNLIWKKESISPTDAFYEFCKLFFIKLKQDKEIHKKFIEKNIDLDDIPLDEFHFSEKWIDKQGAINPVNSILFREKLLPFLKKEREENKKKRIFEENEVIDLQASTIKEVVKLLQNVDFYNIDEDLNGRMFETFLSATVRGKDLGQFFTPRNVVKFMVKMADIEVKKEKIDIIYDGCSGSGGFLIDAMADIENKIENLRSLTDLEKNKLKEGVYKNNIYGTEKSLKNSRVTRMNLWFHGDGSSNVYCLDTLDKQFRYDESLSEERRDEIDEIKNKILNEGLKFDIILTNPPFSTRYEWSKEDERAIIEDYDISYKGLNKDKEDRVTSLKSNVLFIERYHDLLKENGKLLTVIDESVLNADQEKDYRKFILDKFIIKAVISLPRNTFVNADTTTKTSILYLRKKTDPTEQQPPIFMAISNNIGHSDSGKFELEKCDLMKIEKNGKVLNSEIETILEKFQNFEHGN